MFSKRGFALWLFEPDCILDRISFYMLIWDVLFSLNLSIYMYECTNNFQRYLCIIHLDWQFTLHRLDPMRGMCLSSIGATTLKIIVGLKGLHQSLVTQHGHACGFTP
jgi:hypothetical protein